jgi:hypothetical protein
MSRKVLFKLLLASMKTLPNYGYFTASRIRIFPTHPPTRLAATQRDCGAFNVSNLMGITRRMIDIGKKNKFLLFAKCLKMYSFFRICILRLQKVLL